MSQLPADPVGWIVPEIGEEPIRSVVAAFYRAVPDDEVLAPMYPADDLPGAERRLADFLVERCGGEPVYSSERGHPRLRMRHAPFPIDAAARDHWLGHMREALAGGDLREDVRAALESFLEGVARFLQNR